MTTAAWDRPGDLADRSRRDVRTNWWRRRFPWRVTAHLGLGLLSGVAGPVVVLGVLTAWGLGRLLSRDGARAGALPDAVVRWSARAEAVRFAELLDVVMDVPQSPRVLRRSSEPEGRVALNKRERAAVGYWLVRPLVSLIELALLVPLLGIPLTVAAGLVAGWSGWVFPVSDVVAGLPASVAQLWPVIGALGLLAWLRLAVAPAIRGLGAAESRLAGSLLGGREALLEERVDALTASRLLVVDAAERERQRIERDLHDGAQQRLVAMTILLGRAQARLGDRDPEVADLIAQAKAESRSATAELRDLTRGLHPPVLTDRGLDAALSAVAARSPVPVDVVVDLPVRPPPGAEATIYFAIVEALTNVAKHSGAGRASVAIRRAGGIVVSTITDDGHGGADASKGTGLQGIMDRLSGVDGSLTVVSPPGGPTVLTIEVPGGG